jgi:hypothetical protein
LKLRIEQIHDLIKHALGIVILVNGITDTVKGKRELERE